MTETEPAVKGRRRVRGVSDPDWTVRVYKWDVPNVGGRRAWRPADQILDQVQLAHGLSVRMVEVSHERDRAIDAVYLRFPGPAAARAVVDAAEAKVEEALEAVRAVRVSQRSRVVDGPEADTLGVAKAAAKLARTAQRGARTAVKAEARDGLREADAAYGEAGKAAYQEWAARGLHWGTINEVQDAASTADRRVITLRSQGRPAQRSFPRRDGSGVLAVKLQRQTGKPQRTPQLLAGPDGNPWWNVVRLPSMPGRTVVGFGLGSKLPMMEIPVVVDRLPPPGSDISRVKLVARRVAARLEWSVIVTAKIPAPATGRQGPMIAVHAGWRREGDGRTRVLSWRSTSPLRVPANLSDVVVQDGPSWGRLLIPRGVISRIEVADDVQAVRDLQLGAVKERLAPWLDEHPQPPVHDGDDPLSGGVIRQWRSPSRFAILAMRWRDAPPSGDGGVAAAASLEEWRCWDKLRWEAQVNGEQRARRARRETPRRFAAWVAGTAGVVIVDDTDLGAVQARPKLRGVLPAPAEDAAARRRQASAAGEARLAVVQAAAREGCVVRTVSHSGKTVTHHGCGYENPADERWAVAAVVPCDGCGAEFDQDENTTAWMLRDLQQPESQA
jgi:hypothetical protein